MGRPLCRSVSRIRGSWPRLFHHAVARFGLWKNSPRRFTWPLNEFSEVTQGDTWAQLFRPAALAGQPHWRVPTIGALVWVLLVSGGFELCEL